jgi:antitoxin (DNA-binding transcriptional repressor) of toxin-antitoxin stability system
MKTFQVGEFKSKFSKILEEVKLGREIAISFGKNKEKIAVIIPFSKYRKKNKRKLGILENKASFKIIGNFSLTDENFLDS